MIGRGIKQSLVQGDKPGARVPWDCRTGDMSIGVGEPERWEVVSESQL